MELRHLRYFCAVVDAAGFTGAASRIHVTQSTLSHQVRQLEDEVGAALFDRVGRRVRLTEAGSTLLPYARRALQEAEDARRAVAELRGLARGELRIGVVRLFGRALLVPALARFSRAHPAIHLHIDELTGDAIDARLADGSLDLGFGFARAGARGVESLPLYDEPYVVIVGPRHRWARRTLPLAIRDLQGERLGLLSRDFVTRRLLDEQFARDGIEAQVVVEANSIETILQMVELAHLATVMPESAGAGRSALKRLALRGPAPRRRIALLWPRGGSRSHAARALADAVVAAVAAR